MYEAHSAEYIRIYEFIVIEFFLQLKIHKMGTCVARFDIILINFDQYYLVSMVNHETLAMQWHG